MWLFGKEISFMKTAFKKLIQVNLCFVAFVFLSWKERC